MADIAKNSFAHPLLAASVAAGVTGAFVGGTVAMAKTFNQVKKGDLEKDQAVKAVLSESAGTGISIASATAVIGASGLGGSILGLVGFVGVAVGTKYLWDNFTTPEPVNGNVAEEVSAVGGSAKNAETVEAAEAKSETDDVKADTGAEPLKEDESVKNAAKKKTVPKTKQSSSASSLKEADETPQKENPLKK